MVVGQSGTDSAGTKSTAAAGQPVHQSEALI